MSTTYQTKSGKADAAFRYVQLTRLPLSEKS